MTDKIRQDIKERLETLLDEADRLRRALAALEPPTPDKAPGRAAKPVAPRPRPKAAPARARTAPGATRTAVLDALAGGSAMTAGEVAAATGIARATVSTTLSKLAQSGHLVKAERGYRRPDPAATAGT